MPHQVCHAHCPKGGGTGTAVLVVLAVIVAAAVARPVLNAAAVLLHIVLIAVAVLAGLGVTSAAVLVTIRVRTRRAAPAARSLSRPAASPRPVQNYAALRRELPPPQVHLHFHGPVSAEDLAAITDRSIELPGTTKEQR